MSASEPPGSSSGSSLARARKALSEGAPADERLLLGKRFAVERWVGSGAMGAVYRALDERSGETVALKVLAPEATDLRRFDREVRALAELEHPAIVRYVAHGRLEDAGRFAEAGQPFLAMEWLEGPNLRQRLAEGTLLVAETLELGRRLCEALAFVHARGLVHRDIKPSNLLLVSGDASKLTVLDFGIARAWRPETTLTQAGAIVGTVGYMAPEQVEGLGRIDARADLFALGCVLYESLTGRAPFFASNAVAVLAKVLLSEPVPVERLRPDVPGALAELIERLLAKEPKERPSSAEDVLRTFEALLDAPVNESDARASTAPADRGEELRITTVLLVSSPRGEEGPEAGEIFRALVTAEDGKAMPLIDGTTVVSFESSGGPAEQMSRAARCALALRAALPERALVLTTGRARDTAEAAIGLALDRGGEILELSAAAGEVALDALTARLLWTRFDIEREGGASKLKAELSTDELSVRRRPLLGREVPYVGRRKELMLLEATLDEVEEDGVLRAVLVTGPAGIGKSRLALELDAKLEARRTRRLFARATPMAQEASGAVLETLIRSAAGLPRGDERRSSFPLVERYVRELGLEEHGLAAEILGEVVGSPSPNPPSVALRAAREDASVLSYWLSRVIPEWLRAECARQPLAIVLEDVHWADAASLALLDGAFAQMAETRLFVLALARPEVRAQFSPLFRHATVQELPLVGLSRRAGEEMVRAALPEIDRVQLERVIERGEGNPFFLEELVRNVAAGQSDLPETVLAIAEEHLGRVDPEARRVLRAASVFGEHCTSEGVAYLLGDLKGEHTNSLLDALVADEILQQRGVETARQDPEYAFWHVLLRDAAYATLPPEERPAVHARAATWLEARGAEPGFLAEHWERAGDGWRAARSFALAAQAAYSRGDADGAVRHCERALAHQPETAVEAQLLFTKGLAHGFAARFEEAKAPFRRAIPLLEPGARDWVLAVAGLFYVSSATVDPAGLEHATKLLAGVVPTLEPSGPASLALTLLSSARLYEAGVGTSCPFREALARMDRLGGDADPVVRGWARHVEARTIASRDDMAGARLLARASADAFARVGEPLGLSLSSGMAAWIAAELGLIEEARQMVAKTRTIGLDGGLGYAMQFAELAQAVADSRANPERAEEAFERMARTGPIDLRSYAAVLLANRALERGDELTVEWICEELERGSPHCARKAPGLLRGLLALARGDLTTARECLAASETGPEETRIHSIVTAHDKLRIGLHHAAGEEDLAKEAARRAWARLVRIASELPEVDRPSFWARGLDIPETVQLVERVLGAGRGA